jgi:hypothetical protein
MREQGGVLARPTQNDMPSVRIKRDNGPESTSKVLAQWTCSLPVELDFSR